METKAETLARWAAQDAAELENDIDAARIDLWRAETAEQLRWALKAYDQLVAKRPKSLRTPTAR